MRQQRKPAAARAQVEVEHGDIRAHATCSLQRGLDIGGFGHHVEILGAGEQALEALADDGVVVDQQDAQHAASVASTRLGDTQKKSQPVACVLG